MPMGFNQLRELLVGFQPLPFEAVLPSFKEGTRAAFGTVVPELPEGFLEDIGGIQAPVGLKQLLQGPAAIQTQVFTPGKQRVALPF